MPRKRLIKKLEKKENHIILERILEKYRLFWQYPVITEKCMYIKNDHIQEYIGFPWASLLDNKISIRKIPLRKIFDGNDNVTCCQHISFRKTLPFLKSIGVKRLYTPHKIKGEDSIQGIEIVACPHYAVNFEDMDRNKVFNGLKFDEIDRHILYSFRGGWNTSYMSNLRKKIFNLPKKEDTVIEDSSGWHFQDTVYSKKQNHLGHYDKKDDIDHYNNLLLKSKFSLCPSGSGPGSIRFWECLACGSIPVLLSDKLDLPLLPKDLVWEESIIFHPENDLKNLDEKLRSISEEKIIEMRKNCLQIYQHLRLTKIKNITKEEITKDVSTLYYDRENITNDNIYLIQQFYIDSEEKRNKEFNFCLKKNTTIFDKIILLNERIYTQEELRLNDEEFQKIQQVNIEKWITYKIFLDYIRDSGLKGYFILSNLDMYFDDTVFNLRKSLLSEIKSVFSITRYNVNKLRIIGLEPSILHSQDTWIIHSNFFATDTSIFDIKLGKSACDNSVNYRFNKSGYLLYNCFKFIKTYHYHVSGIRRWSSEPDIPPPYLFLKPCIKHKEINYKNEV
tara:strand:+ start:130 stop:1812 length:1683 start_codon:yes stop_codon:yes gene_type:complete